MIQANMKLSVGQIVHITAGRTLQVGNKEFDTFGIDSRKIRKGGLFFAMKGTATDGHLFVGDALRNGAAGAVIEQNVDAKNQEFTLIQVKDSLKALQDLGASVRAKSSATFIGITGSSGKTSTKEFTASLLAERYRVFKSEGNLNSVTGLPLTLLTMDQEECAVIEAGMNKQGEIASLSRIMKPDMAILLNINPVHLEGLQSLETIADEKMTILNGMPENGLVIYNADDSRLSTRATGVKLRKMSFGFSPDASLRILDYVSEGVRGSKATFVWDRGSTTFRTKLCGAGNILNLAAASCAAVSMELTPEEIQRGIEKMQPYPQRGVLWELGSLHVYDDSYNSNPKAVELALRIIEESRGYKRKIAILGDMLELGSEEAKFHEIVGMQAASHHVDLLMTVGPLSRYMAAAAKKKGIPEVIVTEDSEEAGKKAFHVVKPGDLVLVKGSRGMKMETVIESLRKR